MLILPPDIFPIIYHYTLFLSTGYKRAIPACSNTLDLNPIQND